MTDSQGRIYTCSECNFEFKKRSHLLRHKSIHNDDRPFKCEDCDKSFRTQYHLTRHLQTHIGVKSFKCEYDGCEVSCITEWNLKRHIKRTHMGKFKCNKCGEEFKKNKLLQQHNATEHKKNIICCEFPGCARIFSIPAKMRLHMKVHTGKGYLCPVKDCSMKFNLWSECCVHTTECKKKEVKCDVCGKVFRERSNMKAHRKIHAEEREVFQCTYEGCGRFFTKQYNLKVHVQSFHQNLRPYICTKEGCTKRFNFQHLLRKHHEAVHDKRSSDEACEKPEKKKKKRSSRINTPAVTSALSGFIPDLWTRMTPDEIKAYVEGDKMLSDKEESSSNVSDEAAPVADMQMEESLELPVVEPSNSQEEMTDDTVPVPQSSEEYEMVTKLIEIKPFMYKPVMVRRPIRKSLPSPTFTSSSTFSKLEVEECMISDEVDGPSKSVEDSENMLVLKQKLVQDCKVVCDRFRNMFDSSSATANKLDIQRLCRIQSMNESDSSDSEVQNKRVPCVI